MQFKLVLDAIIAVVPLITDLINYITTAKRNGWIKDGDDLRTKIQITTDKEERMSLAQYLSEHRPK